MSNGQFSSVVTAGSGKNKGKQYPLLSDNATILFQGDSVTDGGRDRTDHRPNNGLGNSYAFFAAAYLRQLLPQRNLQCYNRAIGGERVFDLANRWQEDCLELQPDLLSILIGVNDFWYTLEGDYRSDLSNYKADFRALLERTVTTLPQVQLVIGEPFAIKGGSAIDNRWYPAFYEYQEAAKEVAEEYGAAFIPYQSLFEKATNEAPPTYWTNDGVHPTMEGFHLMARAWLDRVKQMG